MRFPAYFFNQLNNGYHNQTDDKAQHEVKQCGQDRSDYRSWPDAKCSIM
ncbi:hypothetical protein AAG928_017325 [Enterobacter hormaechei]